MSTADLPSPAPNAATPGAPPPMAYGQCIEASRRVRWDLERDVLRGRRCDRSRVFLPDALSRVGELAWLEAPERRLMSQLQARTYANLLGLVERAIAARALELARDHAFGDPVAFEALVRFVDEELKHQALFRRLELLAAEGMPAGYRFVAEPHAMTRAMLARSTWATLGLTLGVEILTLAHYRSSLDADDALDPLWRDVFLFHWKEAAQHAVLAELEWRREHARCDHAGRERGVDDLIALLGAVDGILVAQAAADAASFVQCAGRAFDAAEVAAIDALVLKAYRWQCLASGLREPRFARVLDQLVTPEQVRRIGAALAPIAGRT